MHPLKHPRNAIFVGLVFVAIAIVYWAIPYFGGFHLDYAGDDDARHSRDRDVADVLRAHRRLDERLRPRADGADLERDTRVHVPVRHSRLGRDHLAAPRLHGDHRRRVLRPGRDPVRHGRAETGSRGKGCSQLRRKASTCPGRRSLRSSRRSGRFLLFFGLVFGGPSIIVGLVALLLSLLYWGREALIDYDHVAGEHPKTPAVIHAGPPPGVHIPGPSFRPLLASLAVAILFAGLVFGGWLLGVGLLVTILTLLGWLNDARKEYKPRRRGRRDRPPRQRAGTGLAQGDALAHGRPGGRLGRAQPRLVPAAIGQRRGRRPERRPAPSGPPSGAPGDIALVAEAVKFDKTSLTAAADTPFKITFDNRDVGTPHDVDILDAAASEGLRRARLPGPRDPRVRRASARRCHLYVHLLDPPGLDDGRADRRRIAWGLLRSERRRAGGRSSSHSSSPWSTTLAVVAIVAFARPGQPSSLIDKPAPDIVGTTLDGAAVPAGRPARQAGLRQFLGPDMRPVPDRVPAPQGEARGACRRWLRRRRGPDVRPGRPRPDVHRGARRDVGDGRRSRRGRSRQAYRVTARPQSYFIDRDGILRSIQIGEVRDVDFERQYDKISGGA